MNINFFDSVWTEIYNFRSLVGLNLNILDTNLFNILACLIWALISLSKVVKKPGKDLKRNKEFRDEFAKNCGLIQEERIKAVNACETDFQTFTFANYYTRKGLWKRKEKLNDDGENKILEEGRKRLVAIYRDGGGTL
jgi:hypothetical protein